MSASAPVVVPAFIAIAQAALPASFQVRFGTVFGPYIAPQALQITGIHFTEDMYAELGPRYQHEEHYNIECALSSTSGNDDESSRFQEVYALYKDLQVAIANNPTISNTARLGWCRQLDYSPTFDPTGVSVGLLTFEVQVEARVDSLD
jgi:hypothetical protein